MGITGLIPCLKSIIFQRSINDFAGCKVAVDAHCWLHRTAVSCSRELLHQKGQNISQLSYIQHFMDKIRSLHKHGITDILIVFDGMPLPSKSSTNFQRKASRELNINLAKDAEMKGEFETADKYYKRTVSITFEMIQELIKVFTKERIKYIIAPYEADAQLAYLSQTHQVDLIITEDSDSIVYGCDHVLFKYDTQLGVGDYFQSSLLFTTRTAQSLSFYQWTHEQFILFCCLTGCDYAPKLKQFGIKSAHKLISQYKTWSRLLEHFANHPPLPASSSNPSTSSSVSSSIGPDQLQYEYIHALHQAVLTFQHQTVYDMQTQCMRPLRPLPTTSIHYGHHHQVVLIHSAEDFSQHSLDFLGPLLDNTTATLFCRGEIHPHQIESSLSTSSHPLSLSPPLPNPPTLTHHFQSIQNPFTSTHLPTHPHPSSISPTANHQIQSRFNPLPLPQPPVLPMTVSHLHHPVTIPTGSPPLNSFSFQSLINIQTSQSYQSPHVSDHFMTLTRKKRQQQQVQGGPVHDSSNRNNETDRGSFTPAVSSVIEAEYNFFDRDYLDKENDWMEDDENRSVNHVEGYQPFDKRHDEVHGEEVEDLYVQKADNHDLDKKNEFLEYCQHLFTIPRP